MTLCLLVISVTGYVKSPELTSIASEWVALHDAMSSLKQQREAHGLSLGDIAERSGIDKSHLSKLENDPHANTTMTTRTRSV